MKLEHPWPLPPPDLTLSYDDVHVWCASLDQPVARVQQLAHTLSHNERTRAARFRLERGRKRFVVACGTLKAILGRYLGIDPSQVQFRYGPNGKPYLSAGNGSALRFNLAHSHELALCGVAYDREIGVDLEHIRSVPDVDQIAADHLTARENAALRALSGDEAIEAFFRCWTRKEAYMKATGEGLTLPPDQIDVSLSPQQAARLISVAGDPQAAVRWSLQSLAPAPGYAAAIAVAGHGWRLACWRWSIG